MVKLSVLDQSTAVEGIAEAQSIRDTIALASFCEGMGYHRFWVSEHHNHPTIVGTAPEIVMAAIAQTTDRIRIGSAGIMLPHYAPLKVAEQFRVLEALAPGRIDLGLGRAPGSDGKTAYALNPNAAEDAERFPANVLDLMAWVSGQPLPVGHPHQGLVAKPQGPTSPEIWMLGTSDFGAQVAAHFGIPYCFAHFITDGQGVERAMQVYRQNYKPNARYPEPIANICVWALAAETEAEAEHLFSSRAHWKVLREKGDLRALQSPETAAAYEYTDIDKRRLDGLRANAIIGTGASVYKQLDQLADKLGIDEAVVLTWTFDQADRRNSYRLLAEQMSQNA